MEHLNGDSATQSRIETRIPPLNLKFWREHDEDEPAIYRHGPFYIVPCAASPHWRAGFLSPRGNPPQSITLGDDHATIKSAILACRVVAQAFINAEACREDQGFEVLFRYEDDVPWRLVGRRESMQAARELLVECGHQGPVAGEYRVMVDGIMTDLHITECGTCVGEGYIESDTGLPSRTAACDQCDTIGFIMHGHEPTHVVLDWSGEKVLRERGESGAYLDPGMGREDNG